MSATKRGRANGGGYRRVAEGTAQRQVAKVLEQPSPWGSNGDSKEPRSPKEPRTDLSGRAPSAPVPDMLGTGPFAGVALGALPLGNKPPMEHALPTSDVKGSIGSVMARVSAESAQGPTTVQPAAPAPVAAAAPAGRTYLFERPLADGSGTLKIASIQRSDADALQAIIGGLGPEGQYSRFFKPQGGYLPEQIQRLTAPFGADQPHHYGLIAFVVGPDGAAVPAGAARLDRLVPDQPAHKLHELFELSVEVTLKDAGKGIAADLLGQLKRFADERGINSICATVKRGNSAAVQVVQRTFPGTTVRYDDDVELEWRRPGT